MCREGYPYPGCGSCAYRVALHCATDVASIRRRRCSIRVENQILTLTAMYCHSARTSTCVNERKLYFVVSLATVCSSAYSANTDVISEVSKQRLSSSQTRGSRGGPATPSHIGFKCFRPTFYFSELVTDINVA